MNLRINLMIALSLCMWSSIQASENLPEQLNRIILPAGFEIHLYTEGVESARQLALGEHGTVFVGSRKGGKVHAVVDTDGDNFAEQVYVVDHGLKRPTGVEFQSGSLYVGALSRILRYDGIENRLDNPPEPALVSDDFPDKTHHGSRVLRFGPDGKLYVPVGVPCNICEEPGFGLIRRITIDGSNDGVIASGVRNSVGLAFHPETGELWFTDNGRDMLGDDLPGDELNHAPRPGMNFGFPWCHQGDSLDPEFGKGKSCDDYTPPVLKLGAHVAALGLTFYTGSMFPSDYRNQLFFAEHGSWNRSEKVGCRIVLVRFDVEGNALSQEPFASGWLQDGDCWGRPNDVLQMPDGSLLVSDDKAHVIYRISYTGQ